jgi:site-specific DNA-methyltransferase (adenine-specific)
MTVNIFHEDCLIGLKNLENNSIDFCLTDPPYFIDGMANDWNPSALLDRTDNTIAGLPKGMKFDVKQGIEFQQFMEKVSMEIFRVLKPGGFYLSFSQARLYHRLAIAVENCGFEIRDMIGWIYTKGAMTKAFSQDVIIDKNKSLGLSEDEKQDLKKNINGRKTPQLKPAIEPICVAMKPLEGLFVENWKKYNTGLIDMNQKVGENKCDPANVVVDSDDNDNNDIEELAKVFIVPKPSKKEKGNYNNHFTVKPVALCEHLIRIFSLENQTVLDPFNGSGTTAIASLTNNRNYIGFEINQEYIDITNNRINDLSSYTNLFQF